MKGAKEILLQLGMEPSGLVMIPSPRAPEDGREPEDGRDDWYKTANPHFLEAERLRRRFFDTRSLDDISGALSEYERANSYDPKGYYCLPLIVDGYTDRYRLTGDVSDFDFAMEHVQTALCLSTDDRLSRQYAELLLERYNTITNSPFDLILAMEAFRACLFHPGIGAVGPRLQAARAYADLCWMYRDAATSMRPFQLAIDMILNDIAGPYGEVDSRYESLAEVRSTLSAAVGAALDAGELTRAVEWFERGRCVIWNHALRLRASVTELRSIAPGLADDKERIVGELIKAEDVMAQSMMHPRRMQNAMQHDLLAQDLDKLLEKARKLPGLQRFLSPKTTHELRAITVLGPVVVLNAGEHHCDALIFQHGHEEMLHITLPSQVHDGLGHILTRFQRCLRGAGLRTRGSLASTLAGSSKPMGQILLALWKLVVEPIFQALNLMDSTTDSSRTLPRITWCVSGPFAFLPLHAAGIYDAPRSRSHKAYEYAVHSYTPSLSALAEALVHRDIAGQARDRPSVFALSQPATPMQAPLPGTVAEIAAIRSVVGEDYITWLNGAEATTATVLMHIDKHPWVHLACHAVQDVKKPTQSAFMLQDGGLTLRMLMRRSAISGRKALAVLSACQTATGDETVPEEAVHLAAGMLMTGFQSVIATMWSIGDKDAPIVMSAFYKYLLDEAGGDSAQSAHALHYAVKQLREEVGEKSFMQWVPFIHMGI
ncbi:hypothetical protein PENSPDRAFT_48735 [Peniophora sp. CONT]|nr:hypothetical protein PENSPDRAFT_48735 [Peniophora sp. CONT]